jgi:hypothetical protein
LFDENKPRFELAAAQRVDLATLLEALLREIATALVSLPSSRPNLRHWANGSDSS